MNDPPSRMDELLKEYARRRRAEGGEAPPLHSATRHQLQEEVRRVYAAPPTPAPPWYARFLLHPTLAGALALAAVTVGLFVAYWPQGHPPGPSPGGRVAATAPALPESLDRVEEREKAVDEVPRASAQPVLGREALASKEAAPAASAPARAFARAVTEDKDAAAKASLARAPAPAASPAPSPSLPGAADAKGARGGTAGPAILADALPAEAGGRAAPRTEGRLAKQEFALGLSPQNARFQNQASPPARRDGGPAILQSFRITRVGDTVVVLDADGSVYRGNVDTAPAEADKLAEVGPKTKADAARGQASLAQGAASFAFRAIGTNSTLRQVVEISATYHPGESPAAQSLAVAPAPAANQAANALDYQENRARAQRSNAQAPQGRVQGRARLAGEAEFEIDALASPLP